MNWLIMLNGDQWPKIDPAFKQYEASDSWSYTLCEKLDMSGPLLMLQGGSGPIYVPYAAVIAVLATDEGSQRRPVGFLS